MENVGRDVRSLFVSDTHVGWRHSKSAQLMRCMSEWQPQYLYLVGDIFEQKYRTRGCDRQAEAMLLERLTDLRVRGTEIIRLSGNHDEWISEAWDNALGPCLPYAVHTSVDGRKWLVVHGDIFDIHQGMHKTWASRFGGQFYPYLVGMAAAVVRMGLSPEATRPMWCTRFKLSLRRVRHYIRRYERYMVRLAERQECHGVICGHIHLPAVKTIRQTLYANCGDWIEHRSYLVEDATGKVSLLSAR